MEAKNEKFKLIGETNDWWLFDCKKSSNDWKSLKLVLKGEHRKRNFWFGWNVKQKRTARTSDQKLLVEHYPEFYNQVVEKLTPPELRIVG